MEFSRLRWFNLVVLDWEFLEKEGFETGKLCGLQVPGILSSCLHLFRRREQTSDRISALSVV